MTAVSAGVLLYKIVDEGVLEVLIAHMGGPFWETKDARAWSIPKGEYAEADDPWEAAAREFQEEMGSPVPNGDTLDLGTVRQPSGKMITVFALQSDFDASSIQSNTFEMEWPKCSGKLETFPEIDRAEWFDCIVAREKLVRGQVEFLDRLLKQLHEKGVEVVEGPGNPSPPEL